jgi:cytosine/adenosine deaminase-related metal-dependent hydrolase
MKRLTGDHMTDAVIFFDLIGTLVGRTTGGFHLLQGANELMSLSSNYRLGVLCNAGGGHRAPAIGQVLTEAGVYEYFSPDLIVNASTLPRPLPDRRAFAAAAALAEVPVDCCVFVSNDGRMRLGAAAAGMKSDTIWGPLPGEKSDSDAGIHRESPLRGALAAGTPVLERFSPASVFRAGEVDEDNGPTYVLKGRVVTMNSANDVLEDGRIIVQKGRIEHVLSAGDPVPEEFKSAPEVDTGGTIYPGLIDLHNHFVYNALPLWAVPKRYKNRNQWPREKEYESNVSLPIRALKDSAETARALVRYVEAKALVGGTTTGQGIRTQINGSPKLFNGAMRNVEVTGDVRLPEAGTRVPNLKGDPGDIESFRKALQTRVAYFYHLSEGVDEATRGYYTQLADNDLIQRPLAGVHALALRPADYEALAARGAKVVWSPFSNMLLYGQTLDLKALRDSGVTFSIGCVWSPTGSKNLLEELKVASYVVGKQGAGFSARDLVRAVTADAARVVGWQKYLGILRPGAFADLLVISGAGDDPYEHLINSTEPQVMLVAVHGVARYGDREVMKQLNSVAHPLENLTVGGSAKAFQLYAPDSEINDLRVRDAQKTLRDAMRDLPAFVSELREDTSRFFDLKVNEPLPFTVVLDNEYEPAADGPLAFDSSFRELVRTDWSNIAQSVELDALDVNTASYWESVKAQRNIDEDLVESLMAYYSG